MTNPCGYAIISMYSRESKKRKRGKNMILKQSIEKGAELLKKAVAVVRTSIETSPTAWFLGIGLVTGILNFILSQIAIS